jgi:histidinol-phosphate aminotransferase
MRGPLTDDAREKAPLPEIAAELNKALGMVRPAVRETPGYVPGLQPSAGMRVVKLNTNENPYPPSPKVIEAVTRAVGESLRLYPSPKGDALREEAARLYGLSPSQILCGNGSDEILGLIMRTFIGEGDTVAFFRPSYSLYPVLATLTKARTTVIDLPRVSSTDEVSRIPIPAPGAKLFFLSTPNSPYGFGFPTSWIAGLLSRFKGVVVADEAYVDFAPENSLPLLAENPRLIIVRTFSKTYSLAGARLGFAFAHKRLIEEMMKLKDSYNVSRLAQAAGAAALADQEYLARTRDLIIATRARFSKNLREMGFSVVPSDSNFVFSVPPSGVEAGALFERLFEKGFLVRHFKNPEIKDGLRISIGTDGDMDALADALGELIHVR